MRARLAVVCLSLVALAWGTARAQECAAVPKPDACACPLASLRPGQMSVGLVEVQEFADGIRRLSPAERDAYPSRHRTSVVVAPDGTPYVIDGHHHARAMLDAGITTGRCQVVESFAGGDPAAFRAYMTDPVRPLVRLRDQEGRDGADGRTYALDDLPAGLAKLPDDPYRTLAWLVLRRCGIDPGREEFADFRYADYLRQRVPEVRGLVSGSPADRETAVARAREVLTGSAGNGLPGYKADRGCS